MTPLRVGLGWHINRPVDRDIVWHNGQTGGSHGFIALDKARQTAVMVLSNSVSSIDDTGFHFTCWMLGGAGLGEGMGSAHLAAPEVLEPLCECLPAVTRGDVTVTQTEQALVAEATGLGSRRPTPLRRRSSS